MAEGSGSGPINCEIPEGISFFELMLDSEYDGYWSPLQPEPQSTNSGSSSGYAGDPREIIGAYSQSGEIACEPAPAPTPTPPEPATPVDAYVSPDSVTPVSVPDPAVPVSAEPYFRVPSSLPRTGGDVCSLFQNPNSFDFVPQDGVSYTFDYLPKEFTLDGKTYRVIETAQGPALQEIATFESLPTYGVPGEMCEPYPSGQRVETGAGSEVTLVNEGGNLKLSVTRRPPQSSTMSFSDSFDFSDCTDSADMGAPSTAQSEERLPTIRETQQAADSRLGQMYRGLDDLYYGKKGWDPAVGLGLDVAEETPGPGWQDSPEQRAAREAGARIDPVLSQLDAQSTRTSGFTPVQPSQQTSRWNEGRGAAEPSPFTEAYRCQVEQPPSYTEGTPGDGPAPVTDNAGRVPITDPTVQPNNGRPVTHNAGPGELVLFAVDESVLDGPTNTGTFEEGRVARTSAEAGRTSASPTPRTGILSSDFIRSSGPTGILGVMIEALGSGIVENASGSPMSEAARTGLGVSTFYGLGFWEYMAAGGTNVGLYTSTFVSSFPGFAAMMMPLAGDTGAVVQDMARQVGANPNGIAARVATSATTVTLTTAAMSAQVAPGAPTVAAQAASEGLVVGGVRFLATGSMVGQTLLTAYTMGMGFMTYGWDYALPSGYTWADGDDSAGDVILGTLGGALQHVEDTGRGFGQAYMNTMRQVEQTAAPVVVPVIHAIDRGAELAAEGLSDLWETGSNIVTGEWMSGAAAAVSGESWCWVWEDGC